MKVGLYVPCFNAEKTLRRCLESILKQTFPIYEVLVIDDGSTDASARIASEYPVKIIQNKENSGLAYTRNKAINHISSEYVASLDADCEPSADWLSNLMSFFSTRLVVGVGGKLIEVNKLSAPDRWRCVHMSQQWGDDTKNPPFLFGSNNVFRKNVLLEANLYDEKYRTNYEDVDLGRRLRALGYSLVYAPEALVYHLKSDDVGSLLKSYWKWNFNFYKEENQYLSKQSFLNKVAEDFGLANRYIEEDLGNGDNELLGLDFLLAFCHVLMDFEYFTLKEESLQPEINKNILLRAWLTFLDLDLFYHLKTNKNEFNTCIQGKDKILQNFFVLNLLLGKVINTSFKSNDFQAKMCRYMLLSVFGVKDRLLEEKLMYLISLKYDWSCFLYKRHKNIDSDFLESVVNIVNKWIESFKGKNASVINQIAEGISRL